MERQKFATIAISSLFLHSSRDRWSFVSSKSGFSKKGCAKIILPLFLRSMLNNNNTPSLPSPSLSPPTRHRGYIRALDISNRIGGGRVIDSTRVCGSLRFLRNSNRARNKGIERFLPYRSNRRSRNKKRNFLFIFLLSKRRKLVRFKRVKRDHAIKVSYFFLIGDNY